MFLFDSWDVLTLPGFLEEDIFFTLTLHTPSPEMLRGGKPTSIYACCVSPDYTGNLSPSCCPRSKKMEGVREGGRGKDLPPQRSVQFSFAHIIHTANPPGKTNLVKETMFYPIAPHKEHMTACFVTQRPLPPSCVHTHTDTHTHSIHHPPPQSPTHMNKAIVCLTWIAVICKVYIVLPLVTGCTFLLLLSDWLDMVQAHCCDLWASSSEPVYTIIVNVCYLNSVVSSLPERGVLKRHTKKKKIDEQTDYTEDLYHPSENVGTGWLVCRG